MINIFIVILIRVNEQLQKHYCSLRQQGNLIREKIFKTNTFVLGFLK